MPWMQLATYVTVSCLGYFLWLNGNILHNETKCRAPSLTCDKYNSSQRHIHDPVLSSLKIKGIRLIFLFCILEICEHCASEQWVEQRGPSAWSVRSPYWKHLEFNPWVYLKPSASATEFIGFYDMQQGIENESEMIRRTPGIFQAVRQSLYSCA
jgi:hypothetical protein